MSLQENRPKNRTYLTIAVVIALCAAGLAYSQGWFDWSSADREADRSDANTQEMVEKE